MKLLGSLGSPYVRKVRIVMAEKKLDCQFELADVWASDAILGANPLGKVPCLLAEGGEAIYDSRVIVEYLDTLSPVGRLIPGLGRERAEVRTWEALADGVLDALVLARLERTWPGREGQRSQNWIDRQMSRVDASLAAMSRGLGDKPWCCPGTHLTLADIAVGVALGYLDFRFPEVGWRERHANLARLSEKLAARASFADTAPRAA